MKLSIHRKGTIPCNPLPRFLMGGILSACMFLCSLPPAHPQGTNEPSLLSSNIPSNRLKLGGQVYVCGHSVVTVMQGYTNQNNIAIYLVSPGPPRFLATSLEVGKSVDLGNFPSGTELVFGISKAGPSLRRLTIDWYTGPAGRNSDQHVHNLLALTDPNTQIVAFEDAGDDQDFNDVLFQVTTRIPYAFRLTPSAPATVQPSVMPRIYLDSQGTCRLFPLEKRQEPILCRVELASLDGSPAHKVKILVSVATGEGESGHLTERHKVRRPHGWLVPARTPPWTDNGPEGSGPSPGPPATPDPLDVNVSTVDSDPPNSPTLQDQGSAPAERETLSTKSEPDSPLLKLLDTPLEPGTPGGGTREGPLELETDEHGVAEFYYLPPEVAGVETITAALAVPSCTDYSLNQSFTIKRDGFVDLSRLKLPVTFVRNRDAHLSPFWVTPATAEKVKRATLLYMEKQNVDAEIQRIIRELGGRGYDFPAQPQQNRVVSKEAEVFQLLDASLLWGGLFDSEGDYSTASWGHRDGTDVDLKVRHLMRGDPLKASTADAVGDAVLRGNKDGVGDGLVRRLQFRRLQLLIAALKEAGGVFIPESAQYSEGEYLHVSFGNPQPAVMKTVPPQEPSALKELPKVPSIPLAPGLTPANPNQPRN